MEYFQKVKLLVLALFVLKTSGRSPLDKGNKKQVILYHPKPRQSAIVLYGNEGSGQSEADKEMLNALSNNVESVTNLVKAQSEIIENLSTQVSSVVKGTSNEKEFKRVFDKIANQSKLIYNVTKKLNKTINHVNELAAVWSQTSIRFENEMKNLEEDADENEEKIENVEKKIMDKIEKLQEQMKLLHASVNYVSEAAESSKEEWPKGKFCILANGRCPKGFKRHEGHLKSLYLYSSHSQFVDSAKFGSSSIGCFGSYCGQYGNFIGSLTLITCCK